LANRQPPIEFRWAAVRARQLDIPLTLTSGQTFRWVRDADGTWLGAIGETAVALRPEADGFGWATSPTGRWDLIERYFALDVDLDALYREWSAADPEFGRCADAFRGLRVLGQPLECALIAFVCSSCNNVARITRMLSSLSDAVALSLPNPWGRAIRADVALHDLRRSSEAALRALGFGYRARHLAALASWSTDQLPAAWEPARERLMSLSGIGPKVADCVGLFGMGHAGVVPVDTHVRRYVTRRWRPDLAGRSLTPAVYASLASTFRGIMGSHAGWAQQYAFMDERVRRTGRPHQEETR
jgi:N-glycosylase/DNA lyase